MQKDMNQEKYDEEHLGTSKHKRLLES